MPISCLRLRLRRRSHHRNAPPSPSSPPRRHGARLALLAPLAALLIVGCAGMPPAAAPAAAEAPQAAGGAPAAELDGALMYQLMAAELALQQDDAASAYTTYLALARQTRDAQLARRATEIALNARAINEAMAAATLWRELAPTSTEVLQTVAVLLVSAGRYDDAATLFAQQVKESAATLDELTRIQQILARAPDRQAAFGVLTRVAAPYRDDAAIGADVQLLLAGGAAVAGNLPQALAAARAALAQRPDDERSALIVAQLLAQPQPGDADGAQGRAQALELLASFVARNPQARDARLTYARLLVADRKSDAARAQFAQLQAQDPDNLDALFALGVLSLDQPALRADARRFLERYVQRVEDAPAPVAGQPARDPDPAYLNLARLAADERRYADALDWLDRIDGGEQYLAARQLRALVLAKTKRLPEARRLLADTPVETDGERLQLLLTEGQALREAGQHKEALALLEAALKKAPDETALLYDAALAAEKLDRTTQMETYLRRAIALKPDEPHAYNALGYSLAERNRRLDEAQALIARALELAPDDAFILDSMGWVYFRQGKLEQARSYLARAWDARPHAEVGAHYGETLWALGERDAARRVWRESLALEPDSETLRKTLRRLGQRL